MDERSEICQKVKKRARKRHFGDTGMSDLPKGTMGKKGSVYCSDPHLILFCSSFGLDLELMVYPDLNHTHTHTPVDAVVSYLIAQLLLFINVIV